MIVVDRSGMRRCRQRVWMPTLAGGQARTVHAKGITDCKRKHKNVTECIQIEHLQAKSQMHIWDQTTKKIYLC
ncbi:hypothetical protein L596_005865 [Steinernema carpocapsae]|uniref:Uncharacterized protein n=1 Tax=Steinernema carpocapsae TaxID=34508 RepID=A0A4U8V506_STECR|nr:hypothetical protein L596_005865 [Steinernema carpocapsae]